MTDTMKHFEQHTPSTLCSVKSDTSAAQKKKINKIKNTNKNKKKKHI